MNPIIEFNRAISTAVTGLVALAIAFASLVVWAEPSLKRQDLAMQEASATWAR